MHLGLVKTIIVLPGTVLVFIPLAILLVTQDSKFAPELASPTQIWQRNSRSLGPPEKIGYSGSIPLY
jgi:hypothetical protein